MHMKRVPGPAGALVVPEAVVAVALLEVAQVARRVRQRVATRAGAGDQAEADEIGARQRARVVHREVGHQRHAVVLDLAVADQALLVGMVGHQRLQQERPVRSDARRAVLADECAGSASRCS